MGRIVWTDPAIEDLAEIVDYIARDSPRYAIQTGERSYDAVGKLSLGPRAGWVVPEFGLDYFREILMRPYRIIYELHNDDCYIVAIVHGSRDLPRHIAPLLGPLTRRRTGVSREDTSLALLLSLAAFSRPPGFS